MTHELKQRLHRGAKALMDTGRSASKEEALATLRGFRLAIVVGPEIGTSPTLQAALLTAVNAGRRTLLGGVIVIGDCEVPLLLPVVRRKSLGEAIRFLGGSVAASRVETLGADVPVLVLGSVDLPDAARGRVIQGSFEGWVAGVAPYLSRWRLPEREEFTLSGVLVGGLAVSEAFQNLVGTNPAAMRRTVGLSLWQPDLDDEWSRAVGPAVGDLFLPEKLWLIGLGHLGQAYLWTLGMLPYSRAERVTLVLQDFDSLCVANESTSLLTPSRAVGLKKTRHIASWCERRGFNTVLVERPFDDQFTIGPDEPKLALCGVDRVEARRALEAPGFAAVIDAGLGSEANEYLGFQLHTFPGPRPAAEVWQQTRNKATTDLLQQPAYRQLESEGADACGLVEVAGAAVGVPFVGACVSTLVLAEAIRTVMCAHRFDLMDGTLRDLSRRTALPKAGNKDYGNLGFQRPSATLGNPAAR